MSGKWFKPVPYGVRPTTTASTWTKSPHRAREQAQADHRGGTAYSRIWDWAFPRDRR
jgi:glycine hydroxymethyltransferase